MRRIALFTCTLFLVLTACALILDRIVTVCEKRLMRWQPELGR